MGEAYHTSPTPAVPYDEVFQGFKDHCDGHRVETQFVVLELLRSRHPDFHVTCTSSSKCDLHGYAAAGHAEATLDCSEPLDSMRYYSEPRPRLDKKPGVMKDIVRFGRWKYTWKHSEYIVYELVINDPMRAQMKLFYVLSALESDIRRDGQLSATDDLLLAVGGWSTELHEEIYVMDEGHWSKSRELWKSVQGCSWEDVILDCDMKASLIEDVHGFFDNQELYRKLSVPWKRGLILHGVPGNGKTISIKAFINTLSLRPDPIPSLYVKSFDACQGAKYAIRAIFSHARTMAPCLLIFEDLDSLVTDVTRSYFLNEVDGLEANDGILMIGSTNHLDALDPAISKRPSRFDRKYHFQLPGEKERDDYCRFWRLKLVDSDIVDFREELCPIIARMTEGFSFAYLKELFVWALLTIARGGTGEADEEASDKEAATEDGNSNSSKSDNSVVVVKRDEGLAQAKLTNKDPDSAAFAASPAEDSLEKNTTKKTVVPEVEVPKHLQENILLKVIRGQIRMLIDEMDNTKDESSVKKGGLPGADIAVRASRRATFRRPVQMSSAVSYQLAE